MPITALHRHFLAGLDRYDPVTGLNDHPEMVAFHRLVFTTPSLVGRLTQYMVDDEEALAGALGAGIEARLRAAQVLTVQRVLARANWQKIADGRTARDVHPEAVADADQAFTQLRSGTDGPWAPPTAATPSRGAPRPLREYSDRRARRS
jgi:hypothetical protein